MKVLVTGGAGYIGSITAARLMEKGHDVIILDNLENGHQATLDKLLQLVGEFFLLNGQSLVPCPPANIKIFIIVF